MERTCLDPSGWTWLLLFCLISVIIIHFWGTQRDTLELKIRTQVMLGLWKVTSVHCDLESTDRGVLVVHTMSTYSTKACGTDRHTSLLFRIWIEDNSCTRVQAKLMTRTQKLAAAAPGLSNLENCIVSTREFNIIISTLYYIEEKFLGFDRV